jgi:integrase
VKTLAYYTNGTKNLCAFEDMAGAALDSITSETIGGYVAARRRAGLMVASINRELQVLRRMFTLAQEWGKVEKVLPHVRMLPGEQRRERVLSSVEETKYLGAASPLLRDVATILLDCALRPKECFRLRWDENIRPAEIEIRYGKTENARRRIPVSPRIAAVLEMRKTNNTTPWVFPAPTISGHIEPSTLKKVHLKACKGTAKEDPKTGKQLYGVQPFPLYTLRHTCLTRWAPHMDPWTLAKLAGHSNMSITKRYIHPEDATVRAAIDRARDAQGGHKSGHSDKNAASEKQPILTLTN